MPANGRRYALFNRDFSVHHLDGPSEQRRLASAREIRQVLRVFDLPLSNVAEFDDALDRLP
jgi:arylamine N-acetyltransferase